MSTPKHFEAIDYSLRFARAGRTTGIAVENQPRVLQVGKYYPPHRGGMESHLEDLCGQLKKAVDLEVLVANDAFGTSEQLIKDVKVTRVGKLFNLRSAPFCPEMVRKIRESAADIVHIHLPNPAAMLAYLASGHRGGLVFTYHSDIVRQKVLSRLFDPILRHLLHRADAIIVSSSSYLRSSHVLPFYRQKCRVIPFGVQTEHFQNPDREEIDRLRRTYGPRIILAVGRLVYYKGFEHLIGAMNSVDGHLIIVGSGPLQGVLQKKAEYCGVADRITFLPNVKDVIPYYHAADVFVLPSVARSEAFGIVQLEAMACGKPVVNTSLDSGVPSVSLDGVSGITVPPADPKALAAALDSLLNNPLRRAAYGRAGQRRVKKHFTLQEMARKTLDLYHEVMKSSRLRNMNPSPQSSYQSYELIPSET